MGKTMRTDNFLRFLVLVGVVIAAVVGYAVIRAIDHSRFAMEKLAGQLAQIDSKVSQLEKRLNEDAVHVSSTSAASGKSNAPPLAAIANKEFFDPKAEEGGRIIEPRTSETKNMNAIINNEAFVSSLWGETFDSLAERNYAQPELFQPKLAEGWELSDDKLVYTIRLRPGVLWHDFKDPVNGKEWKDVEVTADDFKFYVDVIKNEDVDCVHHRVYLSDLKNVEVLSKYEFKVFWSKRYFMSEMMTLGLQPLPRHLYHAYDGSFDGKKFNDDSERNKIIVGCGPYRFERWDTGQRIVLKRWEKYYGAKFGVAPAIKNYVSELINHPNTQFQALLSGDIDQMMLTPEQWTTRTNIPEFDEKSPAFKIRRFKYPARSYYYIGYNLRLPIFQDRRVRQALTHLVDRERILKDVYYGLGRIINGNTYIDSPYYDKSIAPYPYSVEKARALFKEAGWTDTDGDGILDKDGKKFQFTILSRTSSSIQEKMLPIIKEDMEKAGVLMNIIQIEWSVYVGRLEKKDFEACTLGWSISPFESDPYQLWHSSQADAESSSNHVGFKNKRADEIIEELRGCFDLERRVALVHEFDRILHEEQPYTFLITPDSLQAINKRYRNVRVFPGMGIPSAIMWIPTAEQLPVR